MELLTLSLFCLALLACLISGVSILFALAAGLVLFLLFGRRKGFSWGELFSIARTGVFSARNILITFILIGMLTALWRAAGTIPYIVVSASALIRPSIFLLMAFLLNCLVSTLTGTAFGTGATMGVICAAMGSALGISPVFTGGAILSGVFFGDRCSPVSTSALLVSELTGTNIFDNIRRMTRSALVPALLSCAVYLVLGLMTPAGGELLQLDAVFGSEFRLHPACLLPAAVIVVLSVFRVNVKKTMLASILTAIPVCVLLQGIPAAEIPRLLVYGFKAKDPSLSSMVNGGGITSMLRVFGIVCISSSYSGLFRETGLLDGTKQLIGRIARRTTPFAAMVITSMPAGMIACNQTLSIMLTNQLCGDLKKSDSDFALDLADSVVVTAALIPWSIASGVPLSAAGAPQTAIFFACYLYLLPLWRLLNSFREKHRSREAAL